MRFYGGDATTWLTGVPVAALSACLTMLPRLEGQEAMATVQRVGVGTGSVERGRSEELQRTWINAANEGQPRPRPLRATPDDLRRLGIGFKVVAPKARPPASGGTDG